MATTAVLEQPKNKVDLTPPQVTRLTVVEFVAEYTTRKDALIFLRNNAWTLSKEMVVGNLLSAKNMFSWKFISRLH
jgi:hypothetical protein